MRRASFALVNFGGILTPDRLETVLRTVPEAAKWRKERDMQYHQHLGRAQMIPRRKSPPSARNIYGADLEAEQENNSQDNELAEPETLPEDYSESEAHVVQKPVEPAGVPNRRPREDGKEVVSRVRHPQLCHGRKLKFTMD